MTIQYGIVSTASIVPRFVQGVRDSREGEVRAICSRSLKRAQKVAEKLQIPVAYGSYEELLNDSQIDVVYIATINDLHYEYAKMALLADKHVVVEKPFVLEKRQATDLFRLAHTRRKFLMEAQKEVFLPITEKVKEWAENRIGKVGYINMMASFPGRFDYDHWMFDTKHGGGCLWGSNSYTVAYLQYLFHPKLIEYTARATFAPTKTDHCIQMTYVLDNNILVGSTITMNVPTRNVMEIYGDKGYIQIENYWKAREAKLVCNGQTEVCEIPCPCEFVYEVDHINDCITKGLTESPVMTGEMTVKITEITEFMYHEIHSWEEED
ncbi:MAG: Gfo/Idh/MocA family oxidoreductase [Erysipelotrichaceae bacterium]|nr:Gfo/Idh/MocA family oxidoreductase [Erysipelotrichaceae bacterium]